MSITDAVDSHQEYDPKEISFDVWRNYARIGNIADLDESLVAKFGLIQPEAFSSASTSPVDYAEKLHSYFVNEYKLGEDKLRDVYVLRRISMGLADSKRSFDVSNKDILQSAEFENGIMEGFHIIAENYANTKEYYADFSDPGLVISVFEPVMDTLSQEKVAKVLNTVTNAKNSKEILKEYEERKTKEENI